MVDSLQIKTPLINLLTIDRVGVSMTLKIENINYSKMPPKVAVSKTFLMMKVWREII